MALEIIATRAGLSVKYLRDLKTAGMPIEDTEAALRWIAERPDNLAASSITDAMRAARLRLLTANAEKAELQLGVERGKYISRSESNDADARIAHAVAAMLRRWETELPALCSGLPLGKALGVYREKSRELQTMLGDLQSEFWARHPQTEK